MNLLHIVPSFGLGGMEKVLCSIVNHTSEKYQHKILVLYDNTEAVKWIHTKNIAIHSLNRSASQVDFLILLYKYLKNDKSDILMTYNWGATDAIWLGRIIGIKNIIHSEHGFNVDEANSTSIKKDILRLFTYKMTSQIIVVSNELKNMMREKYFISQSHVSFIANGINTELYSFDPLSRTYMRKLLGFREEDFVVGFSGRLDPIKNFDLMLNIITECVRIDKNFKLLIVGDGPEREHIEQACREKNIDTGVLLVGQKQDVIPYLQAMDAFLLTSLREQMPMTVLEAMAMALPVVATAVGELPSLIYHGQNGLLLDINAPPMTFAQSLLHLRDKHIRHAMGEAARQKMVTDCTETLMVQAYQDVIERVYLPPQQTRCHPASR